MLELARKLVPHRFVNGARTKLAEQSRREKERTIVLSEQLNEATKEGEVHEAHRPETKRQGVLIASRARTIAFSRRARFCFFLICGLSTVESLCSA